AIKQQLEQFSVANESNYADALSRFQSLLNNSDTGDTQGDALLKHMLSMMAKAPAAPSTKEDVAPLVQTAANAATQTGDKLQVSNNILLAGTASVVDANASQTGSNGSGQQQGGGQQNLPTIPGVPATSSSGQTSGTAAGDSAFARALALTGQKPIPEQISL